MEKLFYSGVTIVLKVAARFKTIIFLDDAES